MTKFLKHVDPLVPCSNCNTPLKNTHIIVKQWLIERPIDCPECGVELGWSTVLDSIRNDFAFTYATNLIGANQTLGKLEISPYEVTKLDLNDLQIPTSARILSINTTPTDAIALSEFFGNDLRHGEIPHQTPLIGVVLGERGPEPPVEVNVSVHWFAEERARRSKLRLLDACEMFDQHCYKDVLLPAHVAVEIELNKVVRRLISDDMANKRLDNFLVDAGYGHLLNAVLPPLVTAHELPKLQDSIRGQLNRLKGLRNDVVHGNELGENPNRQTVSKVLAAAIFGHQYLRHLQFEMS